MRRRTSMTDSGSLELLLDTICNTFGGIIFISLLIVILLNTTSEAVSKTAVDPTSRSELINLESERDQLTRRLEQLKRSAETAQQIVSSVVSQEALENAKQFREAQARNAELLAAKSEAVGRSNRAQEEINELKSEEQQLDESIAAREKELNALEEQLGSEIAKKTTVASLPSLASTSLSSRLCFLKGGRLYGPLADISSGPYDSDFLLNEEGSVIYVDPNPHGGADVDTDGKVSKLVRERINDISPTREFIRLWVWNDSYLHYNNTLRVALENAGVKVQLLPLTMGERIHLGDRGPPSKAQ